MNISLALKCTQAQMSMQLFAATVIKEGKKRAFPDKICKIVCDKASEMKKWASILVGLGQFYLNFDLTIYDASVNLIHPIVTLRLNHEGTVLYASEYRMWAQEIEEKWQTINLEPCSMRKQLEYM